MRESALALALGLSFSPALAQPDRSVAIVVGTCETAEADLAGLSHALRIELDGAGIALVDPSVALAAELSIVPPGCHGGTGALVVARAPGAARVTRELAWDRAAPDALRVLALSAVEVLLEALSAPVDPVEPARPAPPPPAVEAPRAAAEPEPEPPAPRLWELYGGARGWAFFDSPLALGGGELGASLSVAPPLRLFASGWGGYGVHGDPRGEVQFLAVGGSVGAEIRARSAPLELFASAWVGVGYHRAAGSVTDPSVASAHVVDGAALAMGLGGGGVLAIDPSWGLVWRLELGYAPVGIVARSDDQPIASTRGLTLALTIGASITQ